MKHKATRGTIPDTASPSVAARDGFAEHETALFVADTINAGFETGLNPAWFEVISLNAGGFKDAAFWYGKLPTPSGKAACADWSFVGRMNGDEVPTEEEADTPWAIVNAKNAVRRWRNYIRKEKKTFPKVRFVKLLMVLDGIRHGTFTREQASELVGHFDFDGVDSDCFAQVAVCGDVIYG